ncbi:MAG: ATP-binding cassette domain-containing protein [Coriobacteriales bacterium]|jgi:peptide/nickel transport system ATP-binding protein|nr:ATP-binding cassette domain-containing protein [Coriobacteriales bacterium]
MLEAHELSFSYGGASGRATLILDDIDLAVAADERLALSAPSGAGKTTLCKLLAGYLTPTSGTITLDGSSLGAKVDRGTVLMSTLPTKVTPETSPCQPCHPCQPTCQPRRAHPVQLVWQHPEQVVDPRTRMHKTLAEAGAVPEGLLERLGIQERWLSRFPHELSGGELQRFCIARALMAQPRYIVADEISTMLDAVTQSLIWQVLLEETAQQHIGLIFVSHSPALTRRIATRVEVL